MNRELNPRGCQSDCCVQRPDGRRGLVISRRGGYSPSNEEGRGRLPGSGCAIEAACEVLGDPDAPAFTIA
jgi:hypothetical protein